MFGMFLAAVSILTQPIASGRGREWWVEVDTDSPKHTYYFGPYDSKDEASRTYALTKNIIYVL